MAEYVAFDFDGTCVEHKHPEIGRSAGAEPWLRLYAKHGHKLILWTFRSGPELEAAKKWCEERKIPLHGVNANPDMKSGSPKAYATIVIDDISFGIPLRSTHRGRPVVDWAKVGPAVAVRLRIPDEDIKKVYSDETQEELAVIKSRLAALESLLSDTRDRGSPWGIDTSKIADWLNSHSAVPSDKVTGQACSPLELSPFPQTVLQVE